MRRTAQCQRVLSVLDECTHTFDTCINEDVLVLAPVGQEIQRDGVGRRYPDVARQESSNWIE